MADYDRRGGYNNRKRRFRDDDNDYRNQRRRHDVPVPLRIRRQLLSIAESPLRRWSEDVVGLARLVAENDDNAHVRESFVTLVCQLIREQPLKTPFVAAVLLVLNTLKPEIVLEVLRSIAKTTEVAVAQGQWREVKLHLRLVACLQTVLEGDGVFPLLDALFERAVDLQTASSDDVIGTELVKIILLTIPYIMAAAPGPQWQQRAADLMEKTDIIASEPHALQKLMDPYHHGLETGGDDDNAMKEDTDGESSGDDGPVPAESLISLLQKQLQGEAANSWPLACLPRPWKLPLEDVELQGKLDDQQTKHELPAIAVPEAVVAGPRPLFPEVYFSVYGAWVDEATTPPAGPAAQAFLPHSVPPLTSVASSLVRDALLDTINGLHFNRNVAARFLIDLDCYFADDTFVKRATPFDRLRDVVEREPGRSTWKPEDVAVDAVFAQLFQLPAAEHKLVYYHAVLAEACKIAPAAVAPSLGRAIRFLYRHSPRMDLELVGRFVDWFAHHLSNFGFSWKWAEWVDDVALPDLHPHKAFILGAIDKEIRLSFAQRIKNTLPPPYQALIRPETELDVPPFKFQKQQDDGEEEVPFAAEGRELAALLRRKAPDDEIQAVVERIHSQALDQGGVEPLVASTDVFTTAVLWVGAKSLSHVLACVERTKDRFLDAGAASEAARQQILTAVMAFWAAHPGVAVSIAEKLLNYAILSPAAVVHWALVAPRQQQQQQQQTAPKGRTLATAHVAELVFHTVDKVTRRVHQLVGASQAAAAAIETAAKAVEDAKERQKNPPPPPPPTISNKKDGSGADDLDVAMEEGGSGGGDAAAAAAAAAALADAVAAAAAEATATVEAAEAALVSATAEAETAQAAEQAEIRAMRELFSSLHAALEPWLLRQTDALVAAAENNGDGDGDGDGDSGAADPALLRAWAVRWQRVVQRRAAMEEAFLAASAAGGRGGAGGGGSAEGDADGHAATKNGSAVASAANGAAA